MTRATARPAAPATALRRSRLSDDLATAVVDLISTDGLVAGQQIPALRPLAEQFGVAVPTMREALRRLEGMGILEFRHGSGIYVGPNSDRLVMANQLAPRPTPQQLIDLVSARLVIEPPLAALAAEHRTDDDVDRLRRVLADSADHLRAGDDRLVTTNIDLHRAIAAATRNPVLEQVLDSLAAVHREDQAEILVLHGSADTDHAEHAELVDLIAGRRADDARVAMHRHLAGVLQVLRDRT